MKKIVTIFSLIIFSLSSFAQNLKPAVSTETPPLGWNSYDCMGSGDEKSLMENLEIFAEKLKPQGYEYFVVDIFWYIRDENKSKNPFIPSDVCMDEFGRYLPSPTKFPNGFEPIIKRAHELDIKFGFWMARGICREAVTKNLPIKGTAFTAQGIADKADTSAWYKLNYGVDMTKPGAQQYYNSVVDLLAEWGADFVKFDDIVAHPDEIDAAANAIQQCGRDMVLSLSPGDFINPDHVKSYKRANMLRITSDVWDERESLVKTFERWEQMAEYGGDGFWLDLDMIPFGYFTSMKRNDKFTPDQKQTFMAQRALAASPLFMGGDLRSTDKYSIDIITNKGMLECNRNGIVGKLVQRKDSIDVWKTPNKTAKNSGWIGIFNRCTSQKNIQPNQLDLGLDKNVKYRFFDVWTDAPIEKGINKEFSVGADGVIFIRYEPETSVHGNKSVQIPIMQFKPKNKKFTVLQAGGYNDWVVDVAGNLTEMQKNRPYVDGLCFHLGKIRNTANFAFNNEIWTENSLHFNELKTIKNKLTTFTDNFILMWFCSQNMDPDFYNDTLWTKIINNATLLGKAVKTAGCKGIFFDGEFYRGGETYSPWWYTIPPQNPRHVGIPPYAGKTYSEVNAKAHQRGKEYISALQKNMPEITIQSSFLYSCIWAYCYNDPNALPNSMYALLKGFVDGMVEGLNPESTLIDGNGVTYYMNETRDYDNIDFKTNYNIDGSNPYFRQISIKNVCGDIPKWNKQCQVGMSAYFDLCYNIYQSEEWNTPDYQSKWMKHNLYNSLCATDQYVWLYIEKMNFWTGADAPKNVDALADIQDAVTKFKNNQPLGYDMFNTKSNSKSRFVYSPVVKITNPANNTILKKNQKITIEAQVDTSTDIAKVEFYANTVKIGEDVTFPYYVTTTFLNADYAIYARVFKTDGSHFTSVQIFLSSGTQLYAG